MRTLSRDEIVNGIDAKLRILFPKILARMTNIDLTMTQLKVVMLLFQESSLRVKDVADFLGVSNPTASDLVDRLVERGVIIRRHGDLTDRRTVLCSLSSQARDAISEYWNIEQERREEIFSAITLSQLRAVNNLLDTVIHYIEQETRNIMIACPKTSGGSEE